MTLFSRSALLLLSTLVGLWGCSSPIEGVTYNAAASGGDLLTYTLDTSSLRYTYEVTAGDVLANKSGSGSLTAIDGFSDYVYETGGGDLVVLFPNELVVVGLASGEGVLAGVPALETDYEAERIEGTFNHVSLTREGGSSETSHGTFTVGADGTWANYDERQVGGTADLSGTWSDLGDGVLEVNTESGKIGHAMLLPGAQGGEVLIVDLDSTERRGILVGQRQRSFTAGALDGTYDVLDSSAEEVYSAVVDGSSVNFFGADHTIAYDTPWTGFITVDDGTLVLVTDDGIFFGGGNGFIIAGGRR